MFHAANELLDLGYNVLPVTPNGKRPPAIEWKFLQERKALGGELGIWFGHGSRNNLGVVCGKTSGDLFVKDFDDIEKARAFFNEYRDRIRTIVETPRPGIHFWFRKPGARNSQGNKEDGRGEGGYAVCPPSAIDGKPYRFLDGFGLVRPEELCEAPEEETGVVIARGSSLRAEIRNVRSYIKKIVAVSGQGGHSQTFRVACKLRDAGLTEVEALAEIIQWNETNAEPKWSVPELLHKIRDAYAAILK